ncbi:TPA: non-canonical purine NTP pyrophosphatase [Candidatus Woesearchaeota archaeon]|nr:non-canonical purine NTP pyrophosphatase [Candidatus Woesearchaeota archaeon]
MVNNKLNKSNKSNSKNKITSITLVTSNLNKLREFKAILEPKIKVEHIALEFPELRHDDSRKIAEMSAEMISEKLKKAVVVEDSGIFITALKDFPGTCTAYVHKRIGLDGILKLMDGIKEIGKNGRTNRQCFYKSAIAYCEPGKKAISFLSIEEGIIAEQIRGKNGFGHDPIFIPVEKGPVRENTQKRTYGEMPDCEQRKKFRRRAIEQLMEWLSKN